METNPYLLAVPFFLISMGIEHGIARKRKIVCYELKDFVNNLSCGLLEQISTVPFGAFMLICYQYIYQNYALFSIDQHSLINWVILWIGVDFLYYWFHRACHRSNFLWIGHSVHHQSTYFNLSVAIRQGILQSICSWFAYFPLALLGFPTMMFFLVATLITFYQFWIHTPLIKSFGWLEFLFNSPSHHRVHHGKNPEYIDKNYGGSLIIWDKLFGSFEKETVAPIYGTTEPLNSWNPFYANIKVAVDTFYYSKYLDSFSKRVKAFFAPPEWIVYALGEDFFQITKRSILIEASSYSREYIFMNITAMLIAYSLFLSKFDYNLMLRLSLGGFIIFSLGQIALVLKDGKPSIKLETLRCILLMFISYSVLYLGS